MAEIDYAFLADFAKVEANGSLTVVGASWTHLTARILPAAHRMAVAGRIKARADEDPIQLSVTVSGPEGTFQITTQGELTARPDSVTYGDGWVGHLFALDLQIPLPAPGLYTVNVEVAGGGDRRLAFEVSAAEPA